MGRIAAPYGVQGMAQGPAVDRRAPETLLSHREWWLRPRGERLAEVAPLQSGARRPHGNTLIVQLSGLDDREAAARTPGGDIGVPRERAPGRRRRMKCIGPTSSDSRCATGRASRWGRVAAVQDFGAHPVLRVEHGEGGARLIPFVEAYVDAVDIAGRRIEVDWQKDYS